MLGKKVVTALRALKSSGPHSFEDLLRELLTELAGQPFYLSSSGWQGGIDGVSASGSIGFEAKRYGEDTGLNVRELLGEIDQAVRERPDLEFWILATTGSLGAQERKQLNDSASEHGITLLVLAGDDLSVEFHPVAGLCGLLPERACTILTDPDWQQPATGKAKRVAPPAIEEIRAELAAIVSHPDFERFRAHIQEMVRELPTWRVLVERHNARVKRAILRSAKAEFGTYFNPDEVIHRTVKPAISQWFDSAIASHEPYLGVLLGERFDGKTWAVLDWLLDRIDSLNVPVFFLGSAQGDNLNSLGEMFKTEVARSLGPYERHAQALLDRHRRWTSGRTPWCLLILDGLNEYQIPSHPWHRHLSDAFARSEADIRPCAVLCTVRKRSWPDLEADATQPAEGRARILEIRPFDDAELDQALDRAGKSRAEIADLSPSVQNLIRRPRFFQLVLEHRDRLGNFEVINEDVLYWLDISDKLRRSRPGGPELWAEDRYQYMLLELARKTLERHPLQWKEVLAIIKDQTPSRPEAGFAELFSEGVLEKRGRNFVISPEHLRNGMGLLILDVLEGTDGQKDLHERLRDLLSPYNDDDTAAAWLRRASVFALLSGNVRPEVIDVLVDEWLRSRNRPSDDFQQLRSITPLLLRPLLRLAPRTWTRRIEHRGLQEISLLIFSESIDREKNLIRESVRQWCRLVPARGPSYVEDQADIEETVRRAVQEPGLERLGLQPKGDSGIQRLQNLALYLESLSPGLLGPDDLLAIVAAHHIPFFFLSESGPWIVRQAAAKVPRDWFAEQVRLATSDCGSLLSQITYQLLSLARRAGLVDLVALVEPSASDEENYSKNSR